RLVAGPGGGAFLPYLRSSHLRRLSLGLPGWPPSSWKPMIDDGPLNGTRRFVRFRGLSRISQRRVSVRFAWNLKPHRRPPGENLPFAPPGRPAPPGPPGPPGRPPGSFWFIVSFTAVMIVLALNDCAPTSLFPLAVYFWPSISGRIAGGISLLFFNSV